MIRLGLIGTDGGARGGHALNVSKIINVQNDWDAKFVAAFGSDLDETRELAEALGIETVVENHTDMLGMVDAVFIMFRDGNEHLKHAKIFIENTIPVFIDKPFTITVEDAEEIAELAKKHNCFVCGGSSLKFSEGVKNAKKEVEKATKIFSGEVAYPLSYSAKYGGVHFYANHIIEPMIEIFGRDVREITGVLSGEKYAAIASYEKFPVFMNYASHEGNICASAYLQGVDYVSEKMDIISGETEMCKDFIDNVKSGAGFDVERISNLLTTVKLSNAFEKSIKEKATVEI